MWGQGGGGDLGNWGGFGFGTWVVGLRVRLVGNGVFAGACGEKVLDGGVLVFGG